MSSNDPMNAGAFNLELDSEDEAYSFPLLEDYPLSPCELLDPIMRGVMAKELADIAFHKKEENAS